MCVVIRFAFGTVSHEQCQNELEKYGVRRDSVPIGTDGTIQRKAHLLWLERRKIEEGLAAGQHAEEIKRKEQSTAGRHGRDGEEKSVSPGDGVLPMLAAVAPSTSSGGLSVATAARAAHLDPTTGFPQMLSGSHHRHASASTSAAIAELLQRNSMMGISGFSTFAQAIPPVSAFATPGNELLGAMSNIWAARDNLDAEQQTSHPLTAQLPPIFGLSPAANLGLLNSLALQQQNSLIPSQNQARDLLFSRMNALQQNTGGSGFSSGAAFPGGGSMLTYAGQQGVPVGATRMTEPSGLPFMDSSASLARGIVDGTAASSTAGLLDPIVPGALALQQQMQSPTLENSKPPQKLPATLFLNTDVGSLSDYQCFLRQQIEVFEASSDDVQYNASRMNRSIVLGQVGLRCRHCAMCPEWERASGAGKDVCF